MKTMSVLGVGVTCRSCSPRPCLVSDDSLWLRGGGWGCWKRSRSLSAVESTVRHGESPGDAPGRSPYQGNVNRIEEMLTWQFCNRKEVDQAVKHTFTKHRIHWKASCLHTEPLMLNIFKHSGSVNVWRNDSVKPFIWICGWYRKKDKTQKSGRTFGRTGLEAEVFWLNTGEWFVVQKAENRFSLFMTDRPCAGLLDIYRIQTIIYIVYMSMTPFPNQNRKEETT